jgi:transposase InsO family protein
MGIRDRLTSPRSRWQNGYVQRVIGSVRRERLDLSIPKTLSAKVCGLKRNRTMVDVDGGARKPSVGICLE